MINQLWSNDKKYSCTQVLESYLLGVSDAACVLNYCFCRLKVGVTDSFS